MYLCVCVCVEQREEVGGGKERERERKELAHTIMETWQVQNLQGGQTYKLETQGKFAVQVQSNLLAEFLLFWRLSVFVVLSFSTD